MAVVNNMPKKGDQRNGKDHIQPCREIPFLLTKQNDRLGQGQGDHLGKRRKTSGTEWDGAMEALSWNLRFASSKYLFISPP